MLVVISDRNKEKKPIYHLPECKYAKMIKTENRFVISQNRHRKGNFVRANIVPDCVE